MKIKNHRLIGNDNQAVPFKNSPNQGGVVQHKYLVMHFTAGRSAQSSVEWFCDPAAKASAHLVIGRDGSITQCVAFDRVAWHAGASAWEGLVGLNQYALGIELDNAGKLTRQNGVWRAWFGGEYPDDQVLVAQHKNESEPAGWQIYPAAQLEVATEVAALLVSEYGLLDVIGHDDIAPERKNDPGPAFPMANFRSKAMGRTQTDHEIYLTADELNIRSGPGSEFSTLIPHPLPKGTRVSPLNKGAIWWKVDVQDTVDGQMDLIGYVHSHWLEPAGSPVVDHILGQAPSVAGYTPPAQSAHALAGVPFAKAEPAPRADHYLAAFRAADQMPKFKRDPSKCKTLLQFPDGTIYYDAKMAIDADGSPRSAITDETGQTETSLRFGGGKSYNAEEIPYFVLPQTKDGEDFLGDMGIELGDLGLVIYKDAMVPAIFADEGPINRIGEGSIRLHELLPVHSPWADAAHTRVFDSSVDDSVLVFVFPKSKLAGLTPASVVEKVNQAVAKRFEALKALT